MSKALLLPENGQSGLENDYTDDPENVTQSYLSTSQLNDSDSSEPPSLTSSMEYHLNCIMNDNDSFRVELEKTQNEEGRSTVLSENGIDEENMEPSPTIKEVPLSSQRKLWNFKLRYYMTK